MEYIKSFYLADPHSTTQTCPPDPSASHGVVPPLQSPSLSHNEDPFFEVQSAPALGGDRFAPSPLAEEEMGNPEHREDFERLLAAAVRGQPAA
jgi:hypothetical protein